MRLLSLNPTQTHPLLRLVKSNAFRELFFFALVGGTGAVFYWGLNFYFTKLGITPWQSIAISLVLLIPPVYYFQHRLTFHDAERRHSTAFPRYVGAQLFGNAIAMVLTEMFAPIVRSHPAIAWLITTFVVAALNWGVLKFWAFRKAPARELVSTRQ